MADATVTTTVTYDIRAAPTVEVLAASLLGTGRLHHLAADLIEHSIPGIHFDIQTIRVERIAPGSWREILSVGLFFAYQEELERAVPPLVEQLLNMDMRPEMEPLATVLTLFVVFGVFELASKGLDQLKKHRLFLERRNVVEACALQFGMPADELEARIHSLLERDRRRKGLIRSVWNFLRPAREPEPRSIAIGNHTVAADIVGAVPLRPPPEDEPETIPLEDVIIELLAHDIEHRGRGWAAMVPAFAERRARLVLAPGTDTEMLFTARVIRGDVVIEAIEDATTGELVPKRIFLTKLSEVLE